MSDMAYQLGWDDGYAEGYACKLIDITEPFMPTGSMAEIEAVASWLQNKYAKTFEGRSEAIGAARGMIRIARGTQPHTPDPREKRE